MAMTAASIIRRALDVARHEGAISSEEWATAHAWLDEGSCDEDAHEAVAKWRDLAEQGRRERQAGQTGGRA